MGLVSRDPETKPDPSDQQAAADSDSGPSQKPTLVDHALDVMRELRDRVSTRCSYRLVREGADNRRARPGQWGPHVLFCVGNSAIAWGVYCSAPRQERILAFSAGKKKRDAVLYRRHLHAL
jgi:hypothetical protein